MFKKPKQKIRKQQLRKKVEDEELVRSSGGGDGEGGASVSTTAEDSVVASIAKARQAQRLLATLPKGSGIKRKRLVVSSKSENENENQRDDDEEEKSLLEKKHEQAKRAFIAKAMNENPPTNEAQAKQSSATSSAYNDEESLFRELAHKAAIAAGRIHHSDGDTPADAQADDGAGGAAVLVGGTGLAEVILPVQQRLDSLQKASNVQHSQQRNPNAALSSAAAASTHSYRMLSSNDSKLLPTKLAATTNNVRSSKLTAGVEQTSGSYHNESDAAKFQSEDKELDRDQERIGFAASRGKEPVSTSATASSNNAASRHSSQNIHRRNNDDRVFSNFVQRHRENQMR